MLWIILFLSLRYEMISFDGKKTVSDIGFNDMEN